MPDDAFRCIRCGHDSSQSHPPAAAIAGTPLPVAQSFYRRIPGIKSLRLCTMVLSSSWFFPVSCASGLFASTVLTDQDDYGPAMTASREPSKLVVVVATVPDTATEGVRKPMIVFFSSLDKFKAENPNYSFLLPPGKGQIENLAAEMLTKYQVTPSGPGAVIVKAHFHHDVPPANLDVRTRYEATDKGITLLNVKVGSDYGGALITGIVFATVLTFMGRLFKRRFWPEKPSASPEASSSTTSPPKMGRLIKIMGLIVFAVLLIALCLDLAG